MNRVLLILISISLFLGSCSTSSERRAPNIVIIYLDDSGWSDFQPFGEDHIQTPEMIKLASEGCMFTNFYVSQAICSASRASLMTGCYPGRTKVFSAHPPKARGLEPDFATMGEVFGRAGYRTAVFGKWHLGDQEDTRPHNRGFDESQGLMYSNDMWKHHPEKPDFWGQFPIDYWKNGEVHLADIDSNDQKYLTKWYTEAAVDFISRHRDSAFLLYVPHSMPHVPIFCSPEFEGKSGKGLYADVIMELDWSVGEINRAIKENGLEENTIIIFSSDNGPWISYGNHAGFTPFREAKGTSFDGGVRSACVIKYPPLIGAGSRNSNTFFNIDLMPSLCKITGTPLPRNEIDGKDLSPLITGDPLAENSHEYYAISTGNRLEAILSGDGMWKLHLPHTYRTLDYPDHDGRPGKYVQAETGYELYNMEDDPYETRNRIEEFPEVASVLKSHADQHLERFYPDQTAN